MEPDIEIGTKFRKRGRRNDEIWTVVDVWKTYDSAGRLVKVRYVASRRLMSQGIVDHDVVKTTILMGLVK